MAIKVTRFETKKGETFATELEADYKDLRDDLTKFIDQNGCFEMTTDAIIQLLEDEFHTFQEYLTKMKELKDKISKF